jgi:hypothetical protein
LGQSAFFQRIQGRLPIASPSRLLQKVPQYGPS